MLALLLLAASLHAQSVTDVPPGAVSATILVCERADGCEPEARALSAHMASLGLPLLDFDAIALAGPGGQEARERYLAAMEGLRRAPDLERAHAAREALRALPWTVPMDDLFALLAELGQQELRAGHDPDAAQAFADAAACSQGRIYDLPPLSPEALPRYLDAADQAAKATLQPVPVSFESGGARGFLFVDGMRIGEVPGQYGIAPGWHRATVESTGRRTAWVGELSILPARPLIVQVDLGPAPGEGALEAATLGAIRGVPPDAGTTAAWTAWARAHELRWVRFVAVSREGATARTPEEVFPDLDPLGRAWALEAAWLDARTGTFATREPGLAALMAEPRPARFRVGASLGYAWLAPRHHVDLEVEVLVGLRPAWSVDVRLGFLRTGQAYFLYPGWMDRQLYPVSAGLRWGHTTGGPWVAVQGLAVVPYALGGLGRTGWEWAPTAWWRVGLEASGGLTDKGWLAGGSLSLARRY
jgi:hypothetical protein